MDFDFMDEKKGEIEPLTFEIYPCNVTTNGTIKGFTNLTTCMCSYCDKACENQKQTFEPPGYFEGFNYLLVGIVYAIIAAIITGTFFFYRRREKAMENQAERLVVDAVDDKSN